MWQCGNVGRRALRSGAPAVTPSGSAQAGNARPRFLHCRTAALVLNKVIHTCGHHVPEPGNGTNNTCLLTRLPAEFVLVDGIYEVVGF